jgi:precorrin-6A synthase
MREILVIGIGTGNPDHVTVQAVEALNRAEVFFVVDKGDEKRGLLDLRDEICRRHIRDQSGFRVVPIADPPRDRGADDYAGAVEDWHEKRAALFESAIKDKLGEDGVGAFLVWGDPALYDSTLRVIERILSHGTIQFDYRVIPGIMSVQVLTAEHRLPLNRIGEPIHITTGRRIADAGSLPDGLDSAVVMLDAGFAGSRITDPEVFVYWGAYLGSADEVLMSGRVVDVADDIARTKDELRAEHGWIMDTYLLRREDQAGEPQSRERAAE